MVCFSSTSLANAEKDNDSAQTMENRSHGMRKPRTDTNAHEGKPPASRRSDGFFSLDRKQFQAAAVKASRKAGAFVFICVHSWFASVLSQPSFCSPHSARSRTAGFRSGLCDNCLRIGTDSGSL